MSFCYTSVILLIVMNVRYILTTNTVTEFVKYVDVIGLEALRSSPVTSMTLTDIATFWKST